MSAEKENLLNLVNDLYRIREMLDTYIPVLENFDDRYKDIKDKHSTMISLIEDYEYLIETTINK